MYPLFLGTGSLFSCVAAFWLSGMFAPFGALSDPEGRREMTVTKGFMVAPGSLENEAKGRAEIALRKEVPRYTSGLSNDRGKDD